MKSRQSYIFRVPAAAPDDVSGVKALFDKGLDPKSIVAVLGKTEGNGCVNDFTRGYASKVFVDMFREYGVEGVSIVMSGGTEGALSPHWIIFARGEVDDEPSNALAIGVARTAELRPEDIGRLSQVDIVACGVRLAMADAGITDSNQVHFVQIKCPLLTSSRVAEAESRGKTTVTRDTLKSMAFSRGAAALGIAAALGEINREVLTERDICSSFEMYSSRASASSGVELMGHEIIVLGMGREWSGPLAINHTVMRDAIDLESVKEARSQMSDGRLTALLVKAEADPSGFVRNRRHTMNDDSDISATRHARAFVGGVLAGYFGQTDLYVSGGAEHQGPPGGGPIALLFERSDK